MAEFLKNSTYVSEGSLKNKYKFLLIFQHFMI